MPLKPLVYIASPYTIGGEAQNTRAQFLVADQLVDHGFLPYPPLHTHFWHFLCPHPYDYWMDLDREWVLRSDVVLRLPGASRGADEEVAWAQANNIPVYFSIEELRQAFCAKPEAGC